MIANIVLIKNELQETYILS